MASNQFHQNCRYCGADVPPRKGRLVSVWDGVDGVGYETSCKPCFSERKKRAQHRVQPTVSPSSAQAQPDNNPSELDRPASGG